MQVNSRIRPAFAATRPARAYRLAEGRARKVAANDPDSKAFASHEALVATGRRLGAAAFDLTDAAYRCSPNLACELDNISREFYDKASALDGIVYLHPQAALCRLSVTLAFCGLERRLREIKAEIEAAGSAPAAEQAPEAPTGGPAAPAGAGNSDEQPLTLSEAVLILKIGAAGDFANQPGPGRRNDAISLSERGYLMRGTPGGVFGDGGFWATEKGTVAAARLLSAEVNSAPAGPAECISLPAPGYAPGVKFAPAYVLGRLTWKPWKPEMSQDAGGHYGFWSYSDNGETWAHVTPAKVPATVPAAVLAAHRASLGEAEVVPAKPRDIKTEGWFELRPSERAKAGQLRRIEAAAVPQKFSSIGRALSFLEDMSLDAAWFRVLDWRLADDGSPQCNGEARLNEVDASTAYLFGNGSDPRHAARSREVVPSNLDGFVLDTQRNGRTACVRVLLPRVEGHPEGECYLGPEFSYTASSYDEREQARAYAEAWIMREGAAFRRRCMARPRE